MYNKNRIEQVKNLWDKGLGATEISKEIGISIPNVSTYLTKLLGYSGKKGRHIYTKRKFTLDERFFENINREDKAYFLGLLYADGSLNKYQSSVTIGLHEKDREILECFTKCLNYTKPLYFKKKTKEDGWNRSDQYLLEVSSKPFRKDLESYGLTPNKSLVLEFPKNIPLNFIRHFVRGYFDGDGCVHVDKKRKTKAGVSIASSKVFCEELVPILLNFGLRGSTCKHSTANCYYFRMWGVNNILNFYNFLYKDSTIFLKRKKEIFDNWIIEVEKVIKND